MVADSHWQSSISADHVHWPIISVHVPAVTPEISNDSVIERINCVVIIFLVLPGCLLAYDKVHSVWVSIYCRLSIRMRTSHDKQSNVPSTRSGRLHLHLPTYCFPVSSSALLETTTYHLVCSACCEWHALKNDRGQDQQTTNVFCFMLCGLGCALVLAQHYWLVVPVLCSFMLSVQPVFHELHLTISPTGPLVEPRIHCKKEKSKGFGAECICQRKSLITPIVRTPKVVGQV